MRKTGLTIEKLLKARKILTAASDTEEYYALKEKERAKWESLKEALQKEGKHEKGRADSI